MSSIIEYVVRVGIVIMFMLIISSFPWPDIAPYLVAISVAVNTLYFFAPFVPIKVLFFFVSLTIIIEASVIGYKLLIAIINFVASGVWHFGFTEKQAPVGEGAIGGGGYGKTPPGL